MSLDALAVRSSPRALALLSASADAPAQAWHHGNLHDALVQRGIEIGDVEGATALSRCRAARARRSRAKAEASQYVLL